MFKNLGQATKRLAEAVLSKEHITIYGDYDVDGLCGVLIVKTFLNLLQYTNFDCVSYTRRTHSLDTKVRSCVLDNQSSLTIIIDTGSGLSDFEELAFIAQMSDVIVGDHHETQYPYTSLPSNVTVVNPSVLDNYPHLSGACVAYEICMGALKSHFPEYYESGLRHLTFYAFSALYADGIYGDNRYCRNLYQLAQTCAFPPIFSNLKYYNPSKRFSLFSFAPPLNACFRNEAFYILNSLYLSKDALSYSDREALLNEMDSIRSYSRMLSEVLVKNGSTVNVGEFVLIDLSGMLNQSVQNKHIWNNKGLVASKVAGDYSKCCVAVVSVGNKYVLSCRDFYNRDIYSLFSTLYTVGGHKSAFGGELSWSEVMSIKDNLKILSDLVDSPNAQVEQAYDTLTEEDIVRISLENEFLHEKDAVLVRIPVAEFEVKWTPESFEERFEQFILSLPSGRKVYIKKEEWVKDTTSVLVHFYKANRMGGYLVRGRC